MSVSFYSELPSFDLKGKLKIRKWLHLVADKHQGKIRALQYIFCDDTYLLEINRQYLNHDSLTDIITFRYKERPDPVESDIYISVERVAENALNYKVTFEKELHRVMVHGLLHLLGFKDKNQKEKKMMREAEDECLRILQEL